MYQNLRKNLRTFLKLCLLQSSISVDQWEVMKLDRSQWPKLIHDGIESVEYSRVQYAAFKRSFRKGEQGPAPGSQSHHVNCDVCGKLCLFTRAPQKASAQTCPTGCSAK